PPQGEGGRPRACPGAAGWGIAQSVINHGQDALKISIDLVVPEPQCPEPITGKVSVADEITPRMRVEVMLATVDFDNEPVLETHEVDDMTIARSLAAKMETLFLQERRWTHSLTSCGVIRLRRLRAVSSAITPTRPPSAATLPLRRRDCNTLAR